MKQFQRYQFECIDFDMWSSALLMTLQHNLIKFKVKIIVIENYELGHSTH